MKINHRKTPEIKLSNNPIEVVEEIKPLGLAIRSDLKWTTNTQNTITKANKRLWMLRGLKNLGAEKRTYWRFM